MDKDTVIHLSKPQRDSYLKFISQEQENILLQIAELQRLYKDNQDTIVRLKGSIEGNGVNGHEKDQTVGSSLYSKFAGGGPEIDPAEKPVGEFDPKASLWSKVNFVLNVRKKGTYARDILSNIYELDPEFKGDEAKDRKNGVNLFALLSTKSGAGKIKRIRSKGEFLYGFPEWFNEDGRLKEGYK